MSIHRDQLIRAAVKDAGLPPEFSETLQQSAHGSMVPRKSTKDSAQTCFRQAARSRVSHEQFERFFHAYNARVRALANPFAALQSEACTEICAALIGQGHADAFGEGDYWVNPESLDRTAHGRRLLCHPRFRARA